jgi:hypothetical protein
MEAQLLPDDRTKLLLSRREDRLIELSLLNALYRTPKPGEEAVRRVRSWMGISVEEAMSLDDELSIIGHKLFGYSETMSDEDRQRYEQVMPKEPRKTGTAWDGLPKIQAEQLPEGMISYTLARGELSIFAGAIDMMLENLTPRRNESGRAEVRLVVGAEIEELEALRDELRRLGQEMRAKGPS